MMNTVDDDHLHGGGGVEREKLFFSFFCDYMKFLNLVSGKKMVSRGRVDIR